MDTSQLADTGAVAAAAPEVATAPEVAADNDTSAASAPGTAPETDTTSPPGTVTFDVGGKVFRIAHSTLEKFDDCMLTKLVSARWQSSGDAGCTNERNADSPTNVTSNPSDTTSPGTKEPVFVDGNSARFEYVLDYMRHGKVFLPACIARQAFLADMDYYNIVVDEGNVAATLSCGLSRAEGIDLNIKVHENKIAKLELTKECMCLASWCRAMVLAKESPKDDSGRFIVKIPFSRNQPSELPFSIDAMHPSRYKNGGLQVMWDECFAEVGLVYKGYQTKHSFMKLRFEKIEG